MANTMMIAVEGIDEDVMLESSIDISPGKTVTLAQKLKQDIPGIISIEKTNSTISTGKWFIVLQRKDEATLNDYIDNTLPTLCS